MDSQEFGDKLWETMNTTSPSLGMLPQGRTSSRHKDTREYRHLLDDQGGLALVPERGGDSREEAATGRAKAPSLHRSCLMPCPPEGEEERRKEEKAEIQNPCQTRLRP
jgi:hypothetical protein